MRALLERLKALHRKHRVVRWAADALILLALVVAIDAWQTRGHLKRTEAPAFALTTLQGDTVSLAQLKGKPTLLVFWAPWCGVCRAESDNFSRVARWVGGRANVLSVALAYDARASVERYVSEQGVDYPVLLGDDSLQRAFRVDAFPTVYVLDAQGRISGSAAGYTTTLGLVWRLLWA